MGNVSQAGIGVVGTSQYIGRTKWGRASYDFDVDGGAIGTITLRGDALPSGAIVLDTFVKVTTAVAGATSTVSLGIQSAADVRTAVVAATAPALTAGALAHGATTRATAPVVTSAAKSVVATIAVADLTAGKFDVIFEYIEVA